MAMWKVIVKPSANPHAWEMLFRDGGFVAIGFRGRDDDSSVAHFRDQVRVGNWVLAHLPRDISGAPHLAVGLGKVAGPYEERAPEANQKWNGPLMRRRDVEWVSTERRTMPPSLRHSNYRKTVAKLTSEQERDVLSDYRLRGGGDGP